jgi:glycosyltransferase 2 family protein
LERCQTIGQWMFALAKLVVSAGLIWWVMRSINLSQLWQSLNELSAQALGLASAVFVLHVLVVAWRWHRIVRMLGGVLPIWQSVKWVFVGLFFNQALPTSVGGDAIRIWSLHSLGSARGAAFSSVAVERVTGVAALGVMISINAFSYMDALSPIVWSALMIAGPVVLGILVLLANADVLIRAWLPSGLSDHLINLANGLRCIASSTAWLIEIGLLGLAAQCLIVAVACVIGKDVGIAMPFGAYVVVVGGAILLSLLPVSLGGWGVREVGMLSLATALGHAPEGVLALAVTWALLPLVLSLPFGLIWLLGTHHSTSEVRNNANAKHMRETK